MKSLLTLLVFLFFMSCGESTKSLDEEPVVEFQLKGSFAGQVLDSAGGAVSGVAITLDPGGMTSTSDTLGNYLVPDVPKGEYTLFFTKENYHEVQIGPFVLNEDEEKNLEPTYMVFQLEQKTDSVINEKMDSTTQKLDSTLTGKIDSTNQSIDSLDQKTDSLAQKNDSLGQVVNQLAKRDLTGNVTLSLKEGEKVFIEVTSADTLLIPKQEIPSLYSLSLAIGEAPGVAKVWLETEEGVIRAFQKVNYLAGTEEIQIPTIAIENSVPTLSGDSVVFFGADQKFDLNLFIQDTSNLNPGDHKVMLNGIEYTGDWTEFFLVQAKKHDWLIEVIDMDGNRVTKNVEVHIFDAPELVSLPIDQVEYDYQYATSRTLQTTKEVAFGKYEVSKKLFSYFYLDLVLNRSGGSFREGAFFWNSLEVFDVELNSFSLETARQFVDDKKPIEFVSFFGALLFCDWLNEKFGFESKFYADEERNVPILSQHALAETAGIYVDTTKAGFRIPLKQEFYVAAKSEIGLELEGYATYNQQQASPVGTQFPNALGIYDLRGNAWEWSLSTQNDGAIDSFLSNGRRFVFGGSYLHQAAAKALQVTNYDSYLVYFHETALDGLVTYMGDDLLVPQAPMGIRLVKDL